MTTTTGPTYAQRIKLLRLIGSATIELRVARNVTEELQAPELHAAVESAYHAAGNALRALVERPDCTLTPEDKKLLDPTITRALAG